MVTYGYQPPLFPSQKHSIGVPSVKDHLRCCHRVWRHAREALFHMAQQKKSTEFLPQTTIQGRRCGWPSATSLSETPRLSFKVHPDFHISILKPSQPSLPKPPPPTPSLHRTAGSWMCNAEAGGSSTSLTGRGNFLGHAFILLLFFGSTSCDIHLLFLSRAGTAQLSRVWLIRTSCR